jgi:hypothetical protein
MTGYHLARGHCTHCGLALPGVWADTFVRELEVCYERKRNRYEENHDRPN